MDSKMHTTVEARHWAFACKLIGWLALLCFGLLLAWPSQLLWSIFLMAFGIYAILVSKGTYKSKTLYLVTGAQLQGKRAQIISKLDTIIGIVVFSLGLISLALVLISLIWNFLLSN